MSVRSYVLINVNSKEMKNALAKLRASSNVLSVEAITGPYDVIAIVEAEDMDLLGKIITKKILGIKGVERSLTCIALKM